MLVISAPSRYPSLSRLGVRQQQHDRRGDDEDRVQRCQQREEEDVTHRAYVAHAGQANAVGLTRSAIHLGDSDGHASNWTRAMPVSGWPFPTTRRPSEPLVPKNAAHGKSDPRSPIRVDPVTPRNDASFPPDRGIGPAGADGVLDSARRCGPGLLASPRCPREGHSFLGYFSLSLFFFPPGLIAAYMVHDADRPVGGRTRSS